MDMMKESVRQDARQDARHDHVITQYRCLSVLRERAPTTPLTQIQSKVSKTH